MHFKYLCSAGLALVSLGGIAGTIPSCPETPAAADLVNRCAPEVTFYVGGASAQAAALSKALLTPGVIFDEAKPFAKVRDIAQSISGSGAATKAPTPGVDGNTIAFVGYGAAGTGTAAGKRVAVIYNKANGSFAAVRQLLAPKAELEENTTLQLTSLDEQKAGTGKGVLACNVSAVAFDKVAPQAGTKMGYSTFLCDTEAPFSLGWGADKMKVMSLALSDLRPSEATPGVIAKWKNNAFPSVTTAMQGFGVIVSPALYTALIAKEVAAGHLPLSCLGSETVGVGLSDTLHALCQPNLPNADYTGLITGRVTSANAFLVTTGDTHRIVLARRTDDSGTQAVSNIFFANQAGTAPKPVNRGSDAAPDVLAGNPGNPALPKTYGDLSVYEKTSTADVIAAVSGVAAGSYGIGVVSLENRYSTVHANSDLQGALYVKLGGISPNLSDVAGTLDVDALARAGILAGYPMTYAMQAITNAKLAEPYATLAAKLVAALQNPAVDLAGVAYIASGEASKNTPYLRANSNYAPLSR
jgi:hypothetical protein